MRLLEGIIELVERVTQRPTIADYLTQNAQERIFRAAEHLGDQLGMSETPEPFAEIHNRRTLKNNAQLAKSLRDEIKRS